MRRHHQHGKARCSQGWRDSRRPGPRWPPTLEEHGITAGIREVLPGPIHRFRWQPDDRGRSGPLATESHHTWRDFLIDNGLIESQPVQRSVRSGWRTSRSRGSSGFRFVKQIETDHGKFHGSQQAAREPGVWAGRKVGEPEAVHHQLNQQDRVTIKIRKKTWSANTSSKG